MQAQCGPSICDRSQFSRRSLTSRNTQGACWPCVFLCVMCGSGILHSSKASAVRLWFKRTKNFPSQRATT